MFMPEAGPGLGLSLNGMRPPSANLNSNNAQGVDKRECSGLTSGFEAGQLGSLPAKTPVSLLQELYSRRGMTPKYELVQIEGAVHEPTFMYRVTVGDIVVATGTGHSKKEAKHAAAKAVLDKIVQQNAGGLPCNPGQPSLAEVNTQVVSPYEDKIPGNPVGALQELCMARRKPPPAYEVVSEEGLPHERQFTIACVVCKLRETGTGKSKKLAKRQAAYKMLQKLKDLPTETPNVTAGLEDEDEIAQKLSAARYAGLKDSKISTLSPPHSQKVSQFHRNLKSSTGEKLAELQTTPLNTTLLNYVQFLHEISVEQNFEVTYVDIEEMSNDGMFQCLVQLSTLPVAVCYGTGKTDKDAQSDAARNALEYLKIMTKK